MPRHALTLVPLLATALLAACGTSSSSVCKPGQQLSCACPADAPGGTQVCAASGLAYLPCVCPSSGSDAGARDAEVDADGGDAGADGGTAADAGADSGTGAADGGDDGGAAADAGADSGVGAADGGQDGGTPGPSCTAGDAGWSAGDWVHVGFDEGFTSDNPSEQTITPTNVASLVRQWGLGCDDSGFAVVSQSPAVTGGRVMVVQAGGKLRAYDATCGALLWQFGKGNAAWVHQPTVSRDGTVFYLEGSDPTELYAVDGQTGAQKWQAPTSFQLGFDDGHVPVVDEARSRVYLVDAPFSGEATLFALDKATGTIEWFANRAKTGRSFPGLFPLLVNGKLYLGSATDLLSPDRMVRLDGDSHAVDLVYDKPSTQPWVVSSYLACSGMLIVRFSSATTHLVAYSLDAPAVVWEQDLTEALDVGVRPSLASACDPASGRVFVPNGPDLLAFDARTGSPAWTWSSFASALAPSVANGLVYFISGTNAYAVEEATGKQVARFPLGYAGYDNTQVAISHGMIYFSGNGGDCDLFALGLPRR